MGINIYEARKTKNNEKTSMNVVSNKNHLNKIVPSVFLYTTPPHRKKYNKLIQNQAIETFSNELCLTRI
jgi:hypothetical protein